MKPCKSPEHTLYPCFMGRKLDSVWWEWEALEKKHMGGVFLAREVCRCGKIVILFFSTMCPMCVQLLCLALWSVLVDYVVLLGPWYVPHPCHCPSHIVLCSCTAGLWPGRLFLPPLKNLYPDGSKSYKMEWIQMHVIHEHLAQRLLKQWTHRVLNPELLGFLCSARVWNYPKV